ncbi:MAG: SAM-dependent methyltransferase [Gammaproteobacteria bacterium]|nr:MAG: SAM-dependent methyltransferase [Gammaproteobacteria bacterium]
MQYSPLLERYLPKLQSLMADKQTSVLDLACGGGRNGLFLLENNIPVTFADVKTAALEQVKQSVSSLSASKQELATYWQVDFEQGNFELSSDEKMTLEQVKNKALAEHSFAAIVVFRYLHRALFEQIKAVIKPGGMIVYETFTEQQAQFGHPKNSDFLLKTGELSQLFADWKILHNFEGVVNTLSDAQSQQAIAQIVAIKPKYI